MRASTIAIALGLAGLAAAAHGGEVPAIQKGIWFCQTVQQQPTDPLYVSEAFAGAFDGSEVRSSFQGMLSTKHGVTRQVSCSMAYEGPGILAKLQGDHQRWYQQIRGSGGKVVETHWSFAPASERLAYLCEGGAQHAMGGRRVSTYFSTDPIEIPGSEQANLANAWIAHLEDLHPGWFYASKGCLLLPNDPARRKEVIDSQAAMWQAQKAEMIHERWTYAPLQKSAADDVPSVFCQALRTDNKQWYVTPVFPMASTADANAAMNAWRTHLRGLKDPDGYVVADSYLSGCDGPGPAKAMKKQSAARAEQIREGGGRVVETGWLPDPSAAATSASSAGAAAAAPPGTTIYQCYMASFGGNFMTPGFATRKERITLNTDWRDFVTKAHPAQGVVRTSCDATTAEAAARNLAHAGYSRLDWQE